MANQAEPRDTPPPAGRPPGQPAPHDALFRDIFAVTENAASLLRAVLSPDVARLLDLGRLTPAPASYVNELHTWRHSDLLFSCPVPETGETAFILVEHQTRTEDLMPVRVLNYVGRIWERFCREQPRAGQVPPVIPLVVYTGRSRWASPLEVEEVTGAVALREAAPRQRARLEILLADLSGIDGRQLAGRGLTPAALLALLLLLIAPRNRHLAADLRPWTGQLRALLDQPGGDVTFTSLVTYIYDVSETPEDQLRELAASLGPDAEEAYMTTAQMIEARTRAEALVETLTVKFGSVPEDVSRTVHASSIGQLKDWAARAVTAETLEQVFE